jgi:hypothetical protein
MCIPTTQKIINMNNPSPSIITVLQEAEEWKTEFDGEIKQVQINGVEILKIHNLTKEVSKVSRQVRVLAFMGTTLALACFVIVSVILMQKIDDTATSPDLVSDLLNTQAAKQHLSNRLYELTGNVWIKDQWVVDPKWQVR